VGSADTLLQGGQRGRGDPARTCAGLSALRGQSPPPRRHHRSGNRNFGAYYQAAARELAEISGRPVVFEFELSGTPEDVARCAEILRGMDEALDSAND